MARAAAAHAPAVASNTALLPFRESTFDAALAMHTLYHLADIPRGIAELRRILRPGGVLVAATNGLGHVTELLDLPRFAVRNLYRIDLPPQAGWKFNFDDGGPLLSQSFSEVDFVEFPGELQVPDAETVVAYVDSMRGFNEALPPQASWAEVLREVGRLAAEEIASHRFFRATARVDCFACR